MPEHFLVPVDFSADADWALQCAMTLGTSLHARLLLLHVREDTHLNPLSYAAAAESMLRKELQNLLERVRDVGLAGDVRLVHGIPWQEIVEVATRSKITLIIMGTHGRTGLRHLLLGSVVERVMRLAPCPMLVTRYAKESTAG